MKSARTRARAARKKETGTLLRFGITLNAARAQLARQNGVCAMPDCNQELDFEPGRKHGDPRRACIDHCHETGINRAILCDKCNAMLGWYEKGQRMGCPEYLNEFGNHNMMLVLKDVVEDDTPTSISQPRCDYDLSSPTGSDPGGPSVSEIPSDGEPET